MSGAGGLALNAAALVAENAISVLLEPQRQIAQGYILPDVFINETENNRVTLTSHPVEYGSPVTDHSYVEQAEVTMQVGWSDSGSYPGYSAFNYGLILTLLKARIPYTLTTGKFQYANMVLESVTETTDDRTEYSLLATLHFKQVFIVYTQTTTLPPATQQAAPQQTAPAQQQGTQAPQAPAQPQQQQTILKGIVSI